MKKRKSFCSLVLAAVLLLLSGSAAAAAKPVQKVPLIYIHGFFSDSIYETRGDVESKKLWPPDKSLFLNDLKNAAPELLKDLTLQRWDELLDRSLAIANPVFSPLYYDESGTPKDESGAEANDPAAIAAQGEGSFRYDWRADPLETAESLNRFIASVCEAAGTTQVDVYAHSFGGIVLLSYLTVYGNERIRAVVFDSVAIYGESFNGELMTGQVTLDAHGLYNYYNSVLASMLPYHAIASELFGAAERLGLIDLLSRLGNEAIRHLKTRIIREFLLPLYCNWPSVWAMVPDEYLDAAMHYVFDELYAGQDHTALQQKIQTYNTQVRVHKAETLRALNQTANVYVLSRTGFASIPLTPSCGNLSDGIVDTKYSSFGATTSDYGETLPDSVLENTNPAYLSPEKDIDASTCLFPEQTWFLRNTRHTLSNDEALIAALLNEQTQATVNTFAAFPRFLIYDDSTETLLPDSGSQTPGLLQRIRLLVADFKRLLSDVLQPLTSRFFKNAG